MLPLLFLIISFLSATACVAAMPSNCAIRADNGDCLATEAECSTYHEGPYRKPKTIHDVLLAMQCPRHETAWTRTQQTVKSATQRAVAELSTVSNNHEPIEPSEKPHEKCLSEGDKGNCLVTEADCLEHIKDHLRKPKTINDVLLVWTCAPYSNAIKTDKQRAYEAWRSQEG